MSDDERKLKLLINHINNVRDNCSQISQYFISNGEFDLGKEIIKNGMVHDQSKFTGIEWKHLFKCDDPLFNKALAHHVKNNKHHPEFWNDYRDMPRVFVGEMCADWKARSSEFGTSFEYWVSHTACKKYKFEKNSEIYNMITEFSHCLFEKAFA